MGDIGWTQTELLAHAERHGHVVTAHRLKRLRAVGLMPRPMVRHGGVRGSRSFYPEWATDQILAVCRAHRRERRFAELAVLVWWDGGWVEPTALRGAMFDLLAPIADDLAPYACLDPADAADELSGRLTDGRAWSATARLLRRRVRDPEDRRSMMSTLALLVFGGDPGWDIGPAGDGRDESLATLVERAAGLDRAREDEISERGPWLLAHDPIGEILAPLQEAGCFDMVNAERVLLDASDDALAQARDDVRFILHPLGTMAATIEAQLGRDVGGLGSLRALVDDASGPAWLVWQTRSLLIMRRLLGDGPLDAVRGELEASGVVPSALDMGPR